MIEKCLGARRSCFIHRTLHHFKVAFFCLFLTIIIFRGTIGAGKFHAPEQDLNEICEHLTSRKRAEPHRLLEKVLETKTTETYNYATLYLNKLSVDEEDDETLDPNKPYSLGPKISN